tara:strand:+ start:125 stop:838 length:714 start_codon:yes stop_codon:yes gene_type:complete
MDLIDFIKNNLFIQNSAASLISNISPFLENTISKYLAIKKALYITAHEEINGNYLEFGVFTGSSFNYAIKVNKKIEKIFGKSDCEFIGFDSFKGFGKVKKEDIHPGYSDNIFSVNERKVIKNINKIGKGQKIKLIKGFYQDTIKGKTTEDLGILNKSRVIMIDCDLKESTDYALNLIKPSLQEGTILIFDDFLDYKGSMEKGECGAFEDFKRENPKILFRRAFDYGYRGRAFIVYDI